MVRREELMGQGDRFESWQSNGANRIEQFYCSTLLRLWLVESGCDTWSRRAQNHFALSLPGSSHHGACFGAQRSSWPIEAQREPNACGDNNEPQPARPKPSPPGNPDKNPQHLRPSAV